MSKSYSLIDKKHSYVACNARTCACTHWREFHFCEKFIFFDILNWTCHFGSTFFKEFHKDLAQIIKLLLKKMGPSEAIFFSPKRGDSLDKFLEEIAENNLHFSIKENYDAEVWRRHQMFTNEDNSWPSYNKDHSYPLLVRITLWTLGAHIFFIICKYFRHFDAVSWEFFFALIDFGDTGAFMSSILFICKHRNPLYKTLQNTLLRPTSEWVPYSTIAHRSYWFMVCQLLKKAHRCSFDYLIYCDFPFELNRRSALKLLMGDSLSSFEHHFSCL